MPNYKLIYFDRRTRVEPVRLMFALADVEYEDKRVPQDEWPEMKAKIGFGVLPVLVVDGKELPQSGAIYRYVGSQLGFYPSDAWERAQVDVVTCILDEFDPEIRKIFAESDAAKKGEVIQAFLNEGSIKHFTNLERVLKQNNEGRGWFVGNKMTNADIQAFCWLHDFLPSFTGKPLGELDLSKFNLLKEFVDRFKSEPKIAAWLKKRPVTEF